MIKTGIPKDLWGVYVHKNVNIYDLKAPYTKCKILDYSEKPSGLMECVFTEHLKSVKIL